MAKKPDKKRFVVQDPREIKVIRRGKGKSAGGDDVKSPPRPAKKK